MVQDDSLVTNSDGHLLCDQLKALHVFRPDTFHVVVPKVVVVHYLLSSIHQSCPKATKAIYKLIKLWCFSLAGLGGLAGIGDIGFKLFSVQNTDSHPPFSS